MSPASHPHPRDKCSPRPTKATAPAGTAAPEQHDSVCSEDNDSTVPSLHIYERSPKNGFSMEENKRAVCGAGAGHRGSPTSATVPGAPSPPLGKAHPPQTVPAPTATSIIPTARERTVLSPLCRAAPAAPSVAGSTAGCHPPVRVPRPAGRGALLLPPVRAVALTGHPLSPPAPPKDQVPAAGTAASSACTGGSRPGSP